MHECLNDSVAQLYQSQIHDKSVAFECVEKLRGGYVTAGGAMCSNDTLCSNGRCVDGHCVCDYDAYCPSCNVSALHAVNVCPIEDPQRERGWQHNRSFQLFFALFILSNILLSRHSLSCVCKV